MPDTTAPPVTGATKAKRSRNPLNQEQTVAVGKAEKVAKAAKLVAYKDKLAARRIAEAFVQQLLNDIKTARTLGSSAVSQDSKSKSATQSETGLTNQLLAGLAEIQSAARQEFYDDDPTRLKAFYSGVDLHTSRELLTTMAQGILKEAGEADLPGITTDKLTALGEIFEEWQTSDDTQGSAQTDSALTRQERDELVASIEKRRRKIQFAADAEWPYTDPKNALIRKKFQLPADRPFVG